MKPHLLSGLGKTLSQFDVYFLDQFGVLHDGHKPYPGVVEALQKLHQAGKKLVVLTNSGKKAPPNLQRLLAMGIPDILDQVVSSGEVFARGFASNGFAAPFQPGKTAFLVGREGEDYGLDDLGLNFCSVAQDADFLLIMGSNAPTTSLDDYSALLRAAAQKNLPAICANPDIWMLSKHGLVPAPGAIARLYESLGGRVHYIGKPYKAIYDLALSLFPQVPKARILGVGDSIEHDIKGAAQAGISSLLVRTGVLADLSQTELDRLFHQHQARPDFSLPTFIW